MSPSRSPSTLENIEAPPGPPPLLSPESLEELCDQGYLSLDLGSLKPHFDHLLERSSAFFQIPEDEKTALFPSKPNDTEQGYTHVPSEKEYLTFRYRDCLGSLSAASISPDGQARAQALLSSAEETWHDAAHLLYRALNDLRDALGFPRSAWDALLQGCLDLPSTAKQATPTLLRVFRYEPHGGVADAHRDLGLLTLCLCRGAGLQARAPGGAGSEAAAPQSAGGWQDAPDVTLMIGDTLRVLTGNLVPAALHRVVGNREGRMSVVFALRMATGPERIDLRGFGGAGEVSRTELWDAIRKSRVNVNAQKEVREGQRIGKLGRSGKGQGMVGIGTVDRDGTQVAAGASAGR